LAQDDSVDEDVYAEEKRVRSDNLPETTAVKIMNLNKTYPGCRKRLGTVSMHTHSPPLTRQHMLLLLLTQALSHVARQRRQEQVHEMLHDVFLLLHGQTHAVPGRVGRVVPH
jgi:hypothetical protein